MSQVKAREILSKIVPWMADAAKSKLRSNYKGVRGRIAIVGGARDYAGAPYFASMSTMHLGADLAYVVCSQGAAPAIKSYSPDLIVMPILDSPSDSEFESEMDCMMTRLHALVIGPGLGRESLLQERAKKLIEIAKSRSMPLVLDADGLILVNENPSLIKSYQHAILTPNRIELSRLLDTVCGPKTHDLRNSTEDEIKALVEKCSTELDVTIMAKGKVDYISNESIQLSTDSTSGSDRRCGGQGDITSGLAAVYMHWINQANNSGASISDPVAWAAYLAAVTTRRANELAFEEHKQGALASDMMRKVQPALESMMSANSRVTSSSSPFKYYESMNQDEINRYARQMIMEEFGPERQLRLKKASVVIIGAGGLGCPSSIYLAAAGVGRIGIVDDDRVEVSNLHRQVQHNIHRVGMFKTESIKKSLLDVNPNVIVDTHTVRLDRYNAVDIVKNYDIVIDATDNLKTRYLIGDACIVAKKPLVSGAALQTDGQLTVYNYDENTPCFRCLFPVPPQAVGSCSENGVLGVIPGIIGVNQALEAIKMGAGLKPSYAGKMLLFDGQQGFYRHVTLGKRKPDCKACGKDAKLDKNLIDYQEFCGPQQCAKPAPNPDILKPEDRITVEQYSEILKNHVPHVLIDVRPAAHSEISRFNNAIPLPVMKLMKEPEDCYQAILRGLDANKTKQIYVVCRKGIASQRGAKIINELFEGRRGSSAEDVVVKDIIGGMTAWSSRVDQSYSCV